MYPEKYKTALALIESKRENNVSFDFPKMGEKEKEELLREFHPEYKNEGYSVLRVGSNINEKVPTELARLIEANTIINESEIDLSSPDYDTDVLIIGGGGAGAAAAIEAHNAGASVLIVTKFRIGDSNTLMAKGGMQASVGADDSIGEHFLDTYGAGGFCADRELVKKLALEAPDAIEWLGSLGVDFDTDNNGASILTSGGGTTKKRMLAKADLTGLEIMRTLKDEVRGLGIKTVCFSAAIELVLDENNCAAGAIIKNMENGKLSLVRAKATVIATGGAGSLKFGGSPTSNHMGTTGDGLVLAYRAGAKLKDAASNQYHPTGVLYPKAAEGALISEKARALGAKLVNSYGDVFINSLETRDVVSAAIIREYACGREVWLDTPMIDKLLGEGTIADNLPGMKESFERLGIDITKEPLLVYPTLHYQNGGLLIDINAETSVKDLFAAGEVTGGIHGKNRLMGNSLADIIVFGRTAGKNAAQRSKEKNNFKLTLDHVKKYNDELSKARIISDIASPKLI